MPYDLPGYFLPLHDYAFRSLKEGRLPEWDPYTYCGLSFAGNIQASLFYPPLWIAFLSSLGAPKLPYLAVEILVFGHVWLAWLLGYHWLRGRDLRPEAAMLGAAVLAFGGHTMTHLQHFGIACGMAWVPLALWGIDGADRGAGWRSLWKTAVGGALILLAGYPPFFTVFLVCAMVYSMRSVRLAAMTGAALAFSLALAAVQLLPALESTALMEREARYGSGEFGLAWLFSMLLPSYFDFSMAAPVKQGDYYYVGAAALLGLACLPLHVNWRKVWPPLAVLAVSAVLFTNPLNLVWRAIEPVPLLAHVLRSWYFMAGLVFGVAVLSAEGLDTLAARLARRPAVRNAKPALLAAMILLILLWVAKSTRNLNLFVGWTGALPVVAVAGTVFLLLRLRVAGAGGRRAAALLLLVLVAGTDYKIHGTGRWANASRNDEEMMLREPTLPGMAESVMRRLREEPAIRIATDEYGPTSATLRFWRLATPQGFDPFVSKQYKEFLSGCVRFESNWLFYPDPKCEEKLRWMGVRYYITTQEAAAYRELSSRPSYRKISPDSDFYQAFELSGVRAPAHFQGEGGVRSLTWAPGKRVIGLQAETSGTLALVESYHPGWRARVDGAPVECSRHAGAFLEVPVPPGSHTVEFEFRSRGLRVGAAISALSLALLLGLAPWRRAARAEP